MTLIRKKYIRRSGRTVSSNRYLNLTKMMPQQLKREGHNEDIPEYNEKPKFKITIVYVTSCSEKISTQSWGNMPWNVLTGICHECEQQKHNQHVLIKERL